jgi:hypothetical protein
MCSIPADVVEREALLSTDLAQQHAFGVRGGPRFNGLSRWRSIEGRSHAAVVRYAAIFEAVRLRDQPKTAWIT